MPRVLVFSAAFLMSGLGDASHALAQDGAVWPDWLGSFQPPNFPRGVGYYFSIPKIVTSYLLLMLWAASADWVSRDALLHKLPYRRWNGIVYGSFAPAFLLVWVIPWFWFSLLLLITAYAVPFVLYVRKRNGPLHEADKVFTRDHYRHLLARLLSRVGLKPPATAQEKEGAAVPVTLVPRGGATQQEEQVRQIAARQSPGFIPARNLIYKALQRRASGIMLDYTQEAAGVKLMIDGVWLDSETQPRQYADPLLATLKLVCGLKPEERRARQQGSFTAVDEGTKLKAPCKFTSQGTKTGERVLVQFEDVNVRKRRLPDMGLRQKLVEELQALMARKNGLIVLAAPPGNGLTTLATVCLSLIDRYTRTVVAVEDQRGKDVEVENVTVTTYDSLEQETPQSRLPAVLRQYPDVLIVPDYADAESLASLCEEAQDERLVLTTVRAKDAVEGLLRPLTTKIPPKKYAAAVTAVVAQRTIRKLCEKCKEAYPPPPQILQRLGIPADKVAAFYRPPTQPRQEVCPECSGLGYLGQTGLVELLVVGDPLRQVLAKEPTLDAVRAAARKAGFKTMEDEGLLLVVKGLTSVQELARVLKEGAAAAPTA